VCCSPVKASLIASTPTFHCRGGVLWCRFDRELLFPMPDLTARRSILAIHSRRWQPQLPVELLDDLAQRTGGYCGADLRVRLSHWLFVELEGFPSEFIGCMTIGKPQSGICQTLATSSVCQAGGTCYAHPADEPNKFGNF
jgi:hypothetical protein